MKGFVRRLIALYIYIMRFTVLRNCFTIMFFLILMIYILDGFVYVDHMIIFFLAVAVGSVLLSLGIVSHCLLRGVFKIGTFLLSVVMIWLIVSLRLCLFLNTSEKEIQKVQSSTNMVVEVYGVVDSTQGRGKSIFIPDMGGMGRILVRESSVSILRSGMRYKLRGYLVEPISFEEFDYRNYLKHKGVYSILNVEEVGCEESSLNLRILRSRVEDVYKRVMPEPESSLLVGILLGSDQEFTEEFELAIRNSGVSHVVAASGYNISILLVALEKMFKFKNMKYHFILGLISIWLFTFLSGLSPSLLRATVMASIYLISKLLNRNISGGVVLVYALTLLSFLNPYILFDIGFMLSFVSTLSLIYFLPCIEGWSKSKFLKTYLFPTLSCTLFTIPISMYYFKTLSWISVITNMLVLPILESTLFWGLLILPTYSFTDFFIKGTYLQLNLFVKITNFMSQFKPLDLEYNPIAVCVGVYLVLVVWSVYRYPVGNWDKNFYVKESERYIK